MKMQADGERGAPVIVVSVKSAEDLQEEVHHLEAAHGARCVASGGVKSGRAHWCRNRAIQVSWLFREQFRCAAEQGSARDRCEITLQAQSLCTTCAWSRDACCSTGWQNFRVLGSSCL